MSSLTINNITFDVPPQHIEIIKQDYNTSVPSLRNAAGAKIKSGRRTITVAIDLTFATGYRFEGNTSEAVSAVNWINQQLVPLLIQARKCPFVYLENEKIRKEVYGNDLGKNQDSDTVNMAGIIKGISGSTSARNPELLTVKIILEIFNYTPYSKDFRFKEEWMGHAFSREKPTELFDQFIKSGTYENNAFINALPLLSSNDLDFYIKEYKRIGSTETPDYSSGWFSYITDGDTQVIYRYVKFSIPATPIISSNSLITETVSFSLETKTPSIPLLSHSIPTAQFLGGAEVSINFNLFAGAELSGETPIGTSRRLGQLNRLLEISNSNSLIFPRIVNVDIIFVRHPLAKLLRYQRYNESPTVAFDYESKKLNGIEPFDPNDCFAAVFEGSSSETLDGLPYCSRFYLTLTEGYKHDWNIVEAGNKVTGDPVVATHQLMKALVRRHGIIRSTSSQLNQSGAPVTLRAERFYASRSEKANEADRPIAAQLIDYLNQSIAWIDYPTADEYIMNAERDEKSLGAGSLTVSRINSLAMDIIKIAFDPNEQRSIFPEYSIGIKEIIAINKISGEDAYPDLLLPKDGDQVLNPDFYFFNEEDDRDARKFKDDLAKKFLDLFPDINEQAALKVINKDAAEEFGQRNGATGFMPTGGPPASAINIPKLQEKESTKGLATGVQNVVNQGAQELVIKGALQEFNGMTYQMRRSMPTFKLFLKEGNIDSLSDVIIDKITGKSPWYSFTDFYDLNSILDIRLVKHKDNPADLLIIRLTNTKDDLVNKTFPGKIIEKKDPSMNDRNYKITKNGAVSEQLNGLKKRRQAELDLFNKKTTKQSAGGINQEAINLIKSYEKLALTAYDDGSGNWTIGYGHTQGVKPGDKITQGQAEDYLNSDIQNAIKIVEPFKNRLNDNEFSALVVAAFNLGTNLTTSRDANGLQRDSSLIAKLKAGSKDIAKELLSYSWAKVNDKAKAERIRSKIANRAGDSGQTTDILSDVILSEGTRVELRLGYDVDPNKLKVEFSGRISRVGGSNILEIVCQGDGIELIQELKGMGIDRGSGSKDNEEKLKKNRLTFRSNAHEIVREVLINAPEVLSFGTRRAQSIVGELESHLPWVNRGGGRSVLENIFLPSLFSSWENFGSNALQYGLLGATVGGTATVGIGTLPGFLIGAGIGLVEDTTKLFTTFFRGSPYIIYEQTLWDILQEQTLRLPGIICAVVPYDRRSTIFMGYPDQLYFYRGPSILEVLTFAKKTTPFGGQQLTSSDKLKDAINNEWLTSRKTFTAEDLNGLTLDNDSKNILKMMKPFRNYHLVTSEHDIVENDISTNSDDVYNIIEVMYPTTTSTSENNFDGSVGFSKYETTKIAADDDLNKDYIKKQTLIFHNANNEVVKDLPQRYAISSLCRSLNNIYKGKLTILGRPGIKPHDIVFIADTYNQVSGPIAVQGVVQTISFDTGWITEIIPDFIALPANSPGYAQTKIMQGIALSYHARNIRKFYSEDILETNVVGPESENSAFLAGSGAALLPGYARSGVATGLGATGTAMTGLNLAKTYLPEMSQIIAKEGSGVLAKAGMVGLQTAGKLFATSVPLLGFIALDWASGAVVNWMRYRQPIIFMPLTRNGKPWYSGLYGMKNNDTWGAIKSLGSDFTSKLNYYYDNIIGA